MFLSKAVETCIEAAGNEFDYKLQMLLLKSAAFGQSFLENFPASKLVSMTRALRILNVIRKPHIGIPLTMEQ